MTNKEALEILIKGIAPDSESNNKCIDLCKKALEKQIPVKCECITQTWGTFCEEIWRCPKCHKDAVRGGFYCWNCCQRRSWITKKVDEK